MLITFSVISFPFRESSLSFSGVSSDSCLSLVITGTHNQLLVSTATEKKKRQRERERAENVIEEQKELQINTCVNYRNGWRTFRPKGSRFQNNTCCVCTWWERRIMELAPKKKKKRESERIKRTPLSIDTLIIAAGNGHINQME